jgi:hypothetical protein
MSTVINNTNTIDSDAKRLNGLVQYFPDPNTAEPLSNAKLYFGVEGQDPTIASNQKLVYALQEDKTVVAIPQPVRTTAGGVPIYNNSVVTLAVSGTFSFKCLNSADVQQYYMPSVTGLETFNFSGEITEEKVAHSGTSFFTFQSIECTTASFYKSSTTDAFFKGQLLQKNVDYRVVSPTQIELLGTVVATDEVLGRQTDTIGASGSDVAKGDKVYSQATISTAKAIAFDIGDVVLISGKDTVDDELGGKYLVVAGSTGVNDNENYINMTNGNQLKLIGSNRRLSKYVDKEAVCTLSSGVLTVDLSQGGAQKVTLTESVSSITILNKNPIDQATFTLEVVQGSTLYNVTWPSNISWAGGTAPTITQTINKRDRFGFISNGANFDGVVLGQDWA